MADLSKIIRLGSKIDLSEKKKIGDKVERRTYQSQISDIIDDDTLQILMPVSEGRIIPLPEGSEYDAYLSSNAGLYTCKVRINKRYKSGNIYLLEVDIISDVSRYQRREYYRLEASNAFNFKPIEDLEVVFYEKTKMEMDTLTAKPMHNANLLDISGGGLRFITQSRNAKGSSIMIYIELQFLNNVTKRYTAVGKILSSTMLANRPGYFEERVEFTTIAKEDREDIIKYIFEVERKRRQKERG